MRFGVWLAVVVVTACTTVAGEDSDWSVDEVVDGDTLVVRADRSSDQWIRLLGINAPEAGECLAESAAARLGSLVGDRTVVLAEDGEDQDRFGRLLRYVYVDDDLVNQTLLREGLAVGLGLADLRLAEELRIAQAQAQALGAGVWARNACGPASDAVIEVTGVEAEAPEWIELTNTGNQPIDLTGWRLRDESSSNRFLFPDGFGLVPGESVLVHSGCGEKAPGRLYWCSNGTGIWNNRGDTVMVLDPAGNVTTYLSYEG